MQALFAVEPQVALDELLLASDADDDACVLRFDRRSPLEDVDTGILRPWADTDPETRYALVGRSLALFVDKEFDEDVGLSPKFLGLLERAHDRPRSLGNLRHRIHPGSWSGSLAAILDRRREMLEPLARHRDAAVRSWLTDQEQWLGEWSKGERAREAESEEAFE